MSDRAQLLEVRVARKTVEAEDTVSFELVSTSQAMLPPFEAGAHIDVHLPIGGLIRQYSLCNAPGEQHRYLICVLKDSSSRGGSVAMHERVHQGSRLWISAPRNKFPLEPKARHSVLLAGGIGVTPILAMAEHLQRTSSTFSMHYSCRTAARMALRERFSPRGFDSNVQLHFDDGPASQQLNLAEVLRQPVDGTHIYVCGPTGFIDACIATARAQGWPDSQIHFESFSARAMSNENADAFEIKLASSGAVIQVNAGQTVVDALAKHGVVIPVSCEQGICGTCVTAVLEGEPDHRDTYFTQEEHALNNCFTPCCSRSKTRQLVLDL